MDRGGEGTWRECSVGSLSLPYAVDFSRFFLLLIPCRLIF